MATRLWVAAAAVLLAVGSAAAAPADQIEVNLKRVAISDLGRPGRYGDVTVVGTTAIVATDVEPAPGALCPPSAATVVDLENPAKPSVVASIALPAGMTAADVEALAVDTPAFTGDLLAVALVPRIGPDGACAAGQRVAYYDVTDAAKPQPLGETAGAAAVSMAQRGDGRVLAARALTAPAGVAVDDVTDPRRPRTLGRWTDPGPPGRCAATVAGTVEVRLEEGGQFGVAVAASGDIYALDLSDPARPSAAGPALGPGGPVAAYAAVLPLGNRTIAVVSEGAPPDTCPGAGHVDARLRVVGLGGDVPEERIPVVYGGFGPPGRLVGSGTLVYVAWAGAGMRVVDFGEVRPRTVAQYANARNDVVGVALLPDHVVITDASQGLFVLARPEEGGGRAGFWSQFLGVLPYFGLPLVAAAWALMARAAARRSPASAPVPAGSGVRRRA